MKFNCPHCEQSLSATKELELALINCPNCQNSIKVPPYRADGGPVGATESPTRWERALEMKDSIGRAMDSFFESDVVKMWTFVLLIWGIGYKAKPKDIPKSPSIYDFKENHERRMPLETDDQYNERLDRLRKVNSKSEQ